MKCILDNYLYVLVKIILIIIYTSQNHKQKSMLCI